MGEWETKAQNAGSLALAKALREANGQPVPYDRLLVVATEAVNSVIAEYRATKQRGGPVTA